MSSEKLTDKQKKLRREIGERIKFIRKDILEKSQNEMIKILKVKQGMISKIERGESPPTVETLLVLKKKSGKTTDWILTGND